MATQTALITGATSNNVQVGLGKVTPDLLLAANVHKQSAPVDGDESAR